MSATMEQQRRPERRRFPRGGRRATDPPGLSPLVMVVEPDPTRRSVTEAVLAVGHFAVAPVASVDGALSICRSLVPAVIVCPEGDTGRLCAGLWPLIVPFVPMTVDSDPRDLIERIRRAVRG